ncbi:unnamed protein product, partial [Schistosoma turkestanicum]
MKLLILSKQNILSMVTWGFGETSKTKNNTIFDSTNSCMCVIDLHWKFIFAPERFNKFSWDISFANLVSFNLIMVVIGVGLLTAFEIWYEQIVASIVPVLTLISAILLNCASNTDGDLLMRCNVYRDCIDNILFEKMHETER